LELAAPGRREAVSKRGHPQREPQPLEEGEYRELAWGTIPAALTFTEGYIMSRISGGKTLYGRTVKTGDFENKKVEVSFDFTVDEGEGHEDILDRAAALAVNKAHEMLGLSKQAPVPVRQLATKTPPAPKPAEKTKAELAAEAQAQQGAPAPKVAKPPKVAEAPKPAEPAAPAKVADPAAVTEDWEAAASIITDKEVVDECSKTNARIKNAQAIRAVVAKYIPKPGQAREIPQELRAAFIVDLKAMKPAA
jgi:hypothetical protein